VTYDYECKACGHVHEEFNVSIEERDKQVECPKCGGECERVLSPVSHHFKHYKRLYGKRVDEGMFKGPKKGLGEI
jgi:putative FmdB family regulatory protein